MPLLFGGALLGSALLLFLLEPMFARMVLPLLGGGAGVWTTCLVFYQALLLLGYLLAHAAVRLPPRRQALFALAAIVIAATVLPIGVPEGWAPSGSPRIGLLLLLARSIGLPFLVLAASSPLLQAWFARSGHARASDPYFLYAASNAGSLLGLFLYPLLLEPRLRLRQQSLSWTAGYIGLAILIAVCAWAFLRAAPTAARREITGPMRVEAAPPLRRRLRWLALALCSSSLLLGVTSQLSIDVPPVPLLWAFPLGLYLLSFVLCFGRRLRFAHRTMLAVQPPLLLAVAAVAFLSTHSPTQLSAAIVLHLVAFFLTAMVCHGELAADRPGSTRLTEFYLWVALGGFLGGALNALLAPVLFSFVFEYPLMLVVAAALRPTREGEPSRWVQVREGVGVAVIGVTFLGIHFLPAWWSGVSDGTGWGAVFVGRILPGWVPFHIQFYQVLLLVVGGLGAWALVRRPLWFAGATLVLVMAAGLTWSDREEVVFRTRTFYGVHRVVQDVRWRALYHGSTMHGMQSRISADRREPLSYYHRGGPLGEVFGLLGRRRLEVGVVGLGVGTVAAYIQPGSRVTFHELDPAVVRIARDSTLFTYLADCRGEVEVVLGDARLTLPSSRGPQFDLLIVDAFSSDNVPIHLLTREALRVYLARLAPRGLLLMHLSARYVDLQPVVANLAADAALVARFEDRDRGRRPGAYASIWAAFARGGAGLEQLEWPQLAPDPRYPLWTDDHASPVALLKWDARWSWLLPWRWAAWQRWPPR